MCVCVCVPAGFFADLESQQKLNEKLNDTVFATPSHRVVCFIGFIMFWEIERKLNEPKLNAELSDRETQNRKLNDPNSKATQRTLNDSSRTPSHSHRPRSTTAPDATASSHPLRSFARL